MKKVLTLSLCLIALVAVFSSCKKTYNSTVNQAYSFTETIPKSTWKLASGASSFGVTYDVNSSNGFPDNFLITDSHAVLVYVDWNNDGTWDGPLATVNGDYTFESYHFTDDIASSVGIEYKATNGRALTEADRYPYDLKVKFVIIRAEDISATSSLKSKDYNSIKKAYNLKD